MNEYEPVFIDQALKHTPIRLKKKS